MSNFKISKNTGTSTHHKMKDEFFGDEEIPFDTKFKNDNDEEKDTNKHKFKLRKVIHISPISKSKYSKGYIAIIILSSLLAILSLCFLNISLFLSFIALGAITFMVWNKCENLYEVVHEDELMLENLLNMENAFLKTTKFSNIYVNCESLYSIIYISIIVSYVISILRTIFINNVSNSLFENVILVFTSLIYIFLLHICSIKNEIEINSKNIMALLILNNILFIIKSLGLFLTFHILYFNINLMFINILLYTLYVYMLKVNKHNN